MTRAANDEKARAIVSWHMESAPLLEKDITQALEQAEQRGFERGRDAAAHLAEAFVFELGQRSFKVGHAIAQDIRALSAKRENNET